MKTIAESLIVDLQQISEHLFGINQVTHLTRACPICSPSGPTLRSQKPSLSLLPASFPSDCDYEMAKMGSEYRFLSKRILVLGDKTASYIKEFILFLHTLNYQVCERPVPTSKLIILCFADSSEQLQSVLRAHVCISKQVILFSKISLLSGLVLDSNVFSILVKDIRSLRRLHLLLLHRIGRVTVQEIIDFCDQNNIKAVCNNKDILQTSFIY